MLNRKTELDLCKLNKARLLTFESYERKNRVAYVFFSCSVLLKESVNVRFTTRTRCGQKIRQMSVKSR